MTKLLRLPGCPIRVPADLRLFNGSPQLFAAHHALLRFSTPRHPPHALRSLPFVSLPRRATTCLHPLSFLLPYFMSKSYSSNVTVLLRTVTMFEEEKERLYCLSQVSFRARGGRERSSECLLRKEVIQPQVPLRLPCYDFTPVTSRTLGSCLPCGLARSLPVQPTPMV